MSLHQPAGLNFSIVQFASLYALLEIRQNLFTKLVSSCLQSMVANITWDFRRGWYMIDAVVINSRTRKCLPSKNNILCSNNMLIARQHIYPASFPFLNSKIHIVNLDLLQILENCLLDHFILLVLAPHWNYLPLVQTLFFVWSSYFKHLFYLSLLL